MKPIPVYQIEEHHEAFYCWNYAQKNGLIPPKGNYLLHIDHHDDFECGGYDIDFARFPTDLEQLYELTYHKLGIADFIAPAIYQGLFSDVHIVKSLRAMPLSSEERVMHCIGNHELRMMRMVPFLHASYRSQPDSPYRFFRVHTEGLPDCSPTGPVVLDVDLDYFCWDDALKTVPKKQLELTRESYLAYTQNPLHPFRILPKMLFHGEEENGHCYLVYEEYVSTGKQPTKERMLQRIDRLCDWLNHSQIRPTVIDICRSRHSGYLPNGVFPWLEETLLARLDQQYGIQLCDCAAYGSK